MSVSHLNAVTRRQGDMIVSKCCASHLWGCQATRARGSLASHATRHPSRRHLPRLRAPGSREHAAQAQRDPGRRPDDPDARARALLPEGAPAAPRPGGVLPAHHRGLHEGRDDLDRRAPHVAGVPGVGRRAVAVPVGSGARRAEGPRHPGVHGSRQRPDDPAHDRAQAGPDHPHHLQRLLVLGPPVDRRPLARPARRVSARRGRTGTSRRRACARRGSPATSGAFTAGTSAGARRRRRSARP